MKLPSTIKGWFNPKNHPDKLLQQFAATNNRKYLSALVDEYNQTLFHYLLSQSDKATAEDILQSTWLKVINKKHLYKTNNSAKYWLFAIARNTLIDELRKQQKWCFKILEESHLQSLDLTLQLSSEQQINQFNAIIDNLPFHQREVFLFQQEGFSLKEIAELTDENQETVKSRLRYARQHLRTHLENRK
ncbi:MAG: sigma-70 family RNA polymerase sigma factor [Colwellia sp.]|nr:sigma-70 family RNA polymerase sigma factor [Colwellia sp.]